MPHPEITIRQIINPDDPAVTGFMEVYRDAFGRAPYFEVYDDDEVILNVWREHLAKGCVFVALDGDVVVGLSCAHVADNDVELSVQQHLLGNLEACPFNPSMTTFMSELAVRETYEGMGIGSMLLLARLRWGIGAGHVHAAMRTADKGSNSAHLYRRYGALEATELLQHISAPAGESQSKFRTYYWGTLQEMVAAIEDHQARYAS